MTSLRDTPQETRHNGFSSSPQSAPYMNEPSHQSDHTTLANLVFNPKRGSQRNKHDSMVPGSIAPNLKRRTSRFGLSSLFSKSKPLATEEVQDKLSVQWECDESAAAPMNVDTLEMQKSGPEPTSLESQDLPETDLPAGPLRNRASKPVLRSKPSFKKELTSKTSSAWDPPPLFQAYPQAVRHVTLRVPTISAEAILRLNAERNSNSNHKTESYTPEFNEMRLPKEKRLKRPTALEVLSKGDWTEKIFLIVTSGYFLQYAGQGPFDRLPEKIMPLSKESAAFASDAIPGKPYVLQVSQIADEDGTLDTEASRSLFKSLGLRSQIKRSASSFLLVFENPEELSSWMIAVRKEIQAMGGRIYRPDEFRKPAEVESIQRLHHKPSQRYLVKRDPHRFSQAPVSGIETRLSHNALSPDPPKQAGDPLDPGFLKRQSMATQKSIDSRTTSNTAESINQVHLDRLRESPRQSYASTVGKTTSSSRDSSPGPSPVMLHADVPKWAPKLNERRQLTSSYNRVVKSAAQQMKISNKVNIEPTIFPSMLPSSHRISQYTPQQQRTPSPAAPNFSVPTFSKRYSSSNASSALCGTASKLQTPPTSLINASPSSPIISEEGEGTGKPGSIIGEFQHLQKSSPRASVGLLPSTSTPPPSAGSSGPPSSSEGSRPFSRRFSSLEYSRGVSPIQLAVQSPSPHPPPTAALPAIPGAKLSSRSSFITVPSTPLAPLSGTGESRASSTTPTPPTALLALPSAASSPLSSVAQSPSPPLATVEPKAELSGKDFSHPPPKETPPIVPDAGPSVRDFTLSSPLVSPSHEPAADGSPCNPVMSQGNLLTPIVSKAEAPPQSCLIQNSNKQEPTLADPTQTRDLSHPLSTQVHHQSPAIYAAPPQVDTKTTFDWRNKSPPLTEASPSPPGPIRKPPPPPLEQRPQLGTRKSSPRVGREPPPVSPLPTRSRISVVSPATNYFEEAAPHPFIPPIKVSDRKFRGSLDGPWNPAYGGGPQRTFIDLGSV